MEDEKELEAFEKWLAIATHTDKSPIAKETVFCKIMPLSQKPGKFSSLKFYPDYGNGRLTLWDDALVLIAKPPESILKEVAGDVLKKWAGKLTFGITTGASSLGKWLTEDNFGCASPEELRERALNPYSAFIPLSNIKGMEGGENLLSLFFGRMLCVLYSTVEGKEFCAHCFGNEFSGYAFRRHIQKAMRNLENQNNVGIWTNDIRENIVQALGSSNDAEIGWAIQELRFFEGQGVEEARKLLSENENRVSKNET